MAWRVVRQPNGKLARFSEVVDDFRDTNCSYEQMVEVCEELLGRRSSVESKIKRADEPGRFEECLRVIEAVHGKEVADKRREKLSK